MIRLGLAFLVLAASFHASAEPIDEDWLQEKTEAAHSAGDLIALGAAVVTSGAQPIVAVTGEAAKGAGTPARDDDAWHVGSNTKALTALLYGKLVENGHAEWGASMPTLFPEFSDEMPSEWKQVTIEDLFAHRSGAGQVGTLWLLSRHNDSRPMHEQRLETVRKRLTSELPGEYGAFEYSNLNYIIAGAAIEQITGMSWEDAFREYILEEGEAEWADGWGFGAPPEGIQGHKRGMFGGQKSVGTGQGADNPQALGPAGTAHAPLASHARLLLEFVNEDSSFITPVLRENLLAPWPDGNANYAMGWGILDDPDVGRIYLHNGSNTMWLSRVALVPSREAVVIVNTNAFNDAAAEATQKLLNEIIAALPAE
ncbi:MAG: serine hydrolase [Pseudomonadota bacterium]|nr:serine hydrolase [Pseudomonadota bacterium]